MSYPDSWAHPFADNGDPNVEVIINKDPRSPAIEVWVRGECIWQMTTRSAIDLQRKLALCTLDWLLEQQDNLLAKIQEHYKGR